MRVTECAIQACSATSIAKDALSVVRCFARHLFLSIYDATAVLLLVLLYDRS